MKIIWISLIILLIVSCKGKNNNAPGVDGHQEGSTLFEIVPSSASGINFENKFTDTPELNGLNYLNFNNGAGVAVADFNNDGLQDIYLMSTLGQNHLYLNTGNFHFKDLSEESGAAEIQGFHTGVTTVDINADGLMDIYICNSGPYKDPAMRRNKLLINQGINTAGAPTFKEESAKYGLDIALCSTQAVFFDFDHDGDLDLFLINHSPDPDINKFENIKKFQNLESALTGDRLYENQNGRFVDISKKAGLINNGLIMGLGVGVSDLNNDGWPDVYVCTDYMGKDAMYINNKNGTFTETSDQSLSHTTYASMGNDLADINNDGLTDIFTCEMTAEDQYTSKTSMESMNSLIYQRLVDLGLHHQRNFNTLQLNNGKLHNEVPVFSDIAQLAGVPATDWSWGPLFFDMDNDGKKDLFIPNGYKADYLNMDFWSYFNRRITQMLGSGELNSSDLRFNPKMLNILKEMPQRKKNNYFFKNNGDLTFTKMNGLWAIDSLTCSNGAAYADFDNDGDLDLVVNNSAGPSFIYKNTSREKSLGNYIAFILKGPAQNSFGIGTKITITQSHQKQMLEQYLTRGFQSSVSPVLHFGLSTDSMIAEVQVIWPDGKEQVITHIPVNQVKTLNYKDADRKHNFSSPTAFLFSDVSKAMNLNYKHEENMFFNPDKESLVSHKFSESLLPHKMSDLGPALAIGDVNKDGLEDFFVGGSKGHPGKLIIQSIEGFKAESQPWNEELDCENIGALFFDADQDGYPDLYLVNGSNEYEEGSLYLQDRLYLNDRKGNFTKAINALPEMTGSGSCVIASDWDEDGDLDLFVGGRQIPGKYPFPASSHLLRNDSRPGKVLFTDITSEVAPQLKDIGMVTDAVFTDIDGDGKQELVIAGEWMAIKIFKNKGGHFEDISEKTGLNQETGWWNCLIAADVNKDGRMDLIAGNLGLNYKYKGSKKYPFEIYSKDFDNNGTLDLVLGYHYQDTLYPVYGRDRSIEQTPFIKQKYPTYRSFAKASLEEIYGGENLKNALNYKATNFASCYFENKGDGTFASHPLPNAAQISSVNSIVAEDIDGDGNLDLIIAGNMYGSEYVTTRNDASIGLYLKGDRRGNFEPVPFSKSGLYINGEVRKIQMFSIGKNKERGILIARNNGFMQLLKIH